MVLVVAVIVYVESGQRRIPVQYAKRVVGRKMYGGQSTHMPIKVNMSGVLPIIFASSILSLPGTVQMFLSSSKYEGTFWEKFFKAFQSDSWWYAGMYFILKSYTSINSIITDSNCSSVTIQFVIKRKFMTGIQEGADIPDLPPGSYLTVPEWITGEWYMIKEIVF